MIQNQGPEPGSGRDGGVGACQGLSVLRSQTGQKHCISSPNESVSILRKFELNHQMHQAFSGREPESRTRIENPNADSSQCSQANLSVLTQDRKKHNKNTSRRRTLSPQSHLSTLSFHDPAFTSVCVHTLVISQPADWNEGSPGHAFQPLLFCVQQTQQSLLQI